MPEFITHTLASAPQAAKPLLSGAQQKFGFIPNLLGAMAESTATVESYLNLSALFDKTTFTITERQLVLLSVSRFRNCTYCLAAHSTIANMQKIPTDIVRAVYFNQPLNDARLEALRTFTFAVLTADGLVGQEALQTFYQAGYHKQHVLEVVLGITLKTLSNFVNHINDTPIDANFLSGIPDNLLATTA